MDITSKNPHLYFHDNFILVDIPSKNRYPNISPRILELRLPTVLCRISSSPMEHCQLLCVAIWANLPSGYVKNGGLNGNISGKYMVLLW